MLLEVNIKLAEFEFGVCGAPQCKGGCGVQHEGGEELGESPESPSG